MTENISDGIRRYNYIMGETNAAYHRAAVKLGLSDSAATILYSLCNYGGRCLLGDIIKLSGMSKQTVNSALRVLEADGVVTLEAESGRRKAARLTEKGTALAENTVARLIRMENEIFAAWSEKEQETYLSFAKRYLDDFAKRVDEM